MKNKNNWADNVQIMTLSIVIILGCTAAGLAQNPPPELKGTTSSVIAGEDAASKEWKEKILSNTKEPKTMGHEQPKVTAVKAAARKRGDQVYNCGNRAFKGKCTMYGFGNYDVTNDREMRKQACGQAAIATAVWEAGSYAVQAAYGYDPARFAKEVYRLSPPKVTIAGWLTVGPGTDWRQYNYGLDQWARYGVKYSWIRGEQEVQNQIAAGRVVAVMIDLGALPRGRYAMQDGAHWVVIYGYDDTNYYVTNFDGNVLRKADLRDAWGASPDWRVGVWAKGHGTSGMGVVVYK